MRQQIKKMVRNICIPLSYMYPENIVIGFKEIHKYIYSEKVARKFNKVDKEFLITPPAYLKGSKYMKLGKNFVAGERLIMECWDEYENIKYSPQLIIGDNAHLGKYNHIGCINKITIGNNFLAGRNVFITDHFHGGGDLTDIMIPPIKRELYSKGSVEIGDNVWVGENVSIMPNVKIGNNVIIGANAVVTKNIDDNVIAAGVPAKAIRRLSHNPFVD